MKNIFDWNLFLLFILMMEEQPPTIEEFAYKCKQLNVKNIELAYDILYSPESDIDLSIKYGVNVDSIWQQRNRLKKKFGNVY